MAFIYFATQLTIVAAAGRDTDHGLRCRKKTGSMVPPEVSVGDVSLALPSTVSVCERT
jgi:hypothetical protein